MRKRVSGVLVLLLAGCNGDAPGQWAAIVYPDGADRSKFETTYHFQSHGMCKRAAMETIQALPDPKKADYSCGFMCEPDPKAPGHPLCRSMGR